MAVSKARVREAQRALNEFTTKHLSFIDPLIVDGDKGPSTNRRLRESRYWLGYVKSQRTHGEGDDIDDQLIWRLLHPKRRNKRWKFTRKDVARGIKRRAAQRTLAHHSRYVGRAKGLVELDGHQVCAWMAPQIMWVRDNTRWIGKVISGFRTKLYSRHLCIAMCGQPTCDGRCAGVNTNHVGQVMPGGAIDVTDWAEFERGLNEAPDSLMGPRLRNDLANDPNHFSATGH